MSDIADKIYAATGLTVNAETAAAIERLIQAENKKLRAALKECADDLEEEINGKYRGSQNIYIHEMHRFDRDMAPVTNARKLLQGEKE